KLERRPVDDIVWRTAQFVPVPNPMLDEAAIVAAIGNKEGSVVSRNRPSFQLAWLRRCQAETPLQVSSMQIGDISLLHLPAESFLEYQLFAQKQAAGQFVATAAYGDGGPWYI